MFWIYGLRRNLILKLISLVSLYFVDVIRSFKFIYLAHVVFLLDSAALEHFSKSKADLVCGNNSLLLSWKDLLTSAQKGKRRPGE